MEDPFVDTYRPPDVNTVITLPDDGDIPDGLVSARRQKFARQPSVCVSDRKPSPPDARERESTWFG
ncbi:uncharacterized protein LY79DRAFT_592841 [Colletotrichum navitas]|uniref:Uncharacterized protein n=1 Tax=Colletotrichum navitas TaxID=681940 RepID=A0AAD8PRL2_9PEZI|nr:uncharacterized protein LY79DRAFT_592841 [Colletotrichum navitas]KAK1579438.1 hypothetical protein LY79DRAFT_592841 [Colletotrichum navitas]